jgi:hypothetical protein
MAWNNKNQNGNNGNADFNICTNWGLYCHEFRDIKKKDGEVIGVSLRCTMNGRKREDGSFPKSMSVSVNCYSDSCTETPQEDPTGKKISVDGRFQIGEYVNKDGVAIAQYTINATSVKLS